MTTSLKVLLAVSLMVVLAACGDDPTPAPADMSITPDADTDAGPTDDAGPVDTDAGPVDSDASTVDDAGSTDDAGAADDAGPVDTDAGAADDAG
jgi:hypothetical protein